MKATHPKVTAQNRGPAAAAANRDAILQSARQLFAERGLDVPFSAIAQEAEVSQGVLYRHFRSRVDLALAVFEENVATIIRASNMHVHPEDRFHAAWKQMVDLTVSHVAFIETVAESALDPRIEDLSEEIRVFLRPVLAEAQASGAAPADITLETLFVALRASYGLVKTHPISEGSARDEVEGLLEALGLPTAP